MQRRLTWVLFGSALCLFALIYFVDRRIPGTAERRAPKPLLPVTTAADIQAIQVALPSGGTLRAARTNGEWALIQPPYPARESAIEAFATNLVELRVFDRISGREANLQGAKSFGLEPPRAVVELQSSSNTFRFEIGGIAPLTSNVYLRLPRSGEIILANANLLPLLPRNTNEWRSSALFDLSGLDFDHIQVRAGQRAFELGRVRSNHLWQISKPVPARADQDRVLELLRLLRGAEVSEFISDRPGADLEPFGLQIPEVEVGFSSGTNRLYSIEFGNSSTNRTNQVFARLIGQTNIVLVPRQLVDYLKQPYKNFHDPRLVTINPGALDRIVVHSKEEFTLQRQPGGSWIIEDKSKTPVDRELFGKFVASVGSLQIVDIVKELPTEADLKTLGFIPPVASYAFFEKLTNATGITTNILFTDLNFGGAQIDKIYVRRSDENPIYQTQLAVMLDLPRRAFALRDRKIWRFSTNAIGSVAIVENGSTNALVRTAGGWSGDAVANARAEEVVFRLSQLDAQEWVDKGAAKLATFGITEASPWLKVELRSNGEPSGQTLSLHLGRQTLRHDVYAATVFPGETEPAIFEFPGDLYQMILQAIPAPK